MTGNIRSNRPARAAIAAVLALTATPLLAQTAAPTAVPSVALPMAPEVTAPPVATVPAQPAQDNVEFTPSQPVVQATAPVEERIAAATAAAEAEQAAAAAEAPRTETRRAETRRAAPVRTAQPVQAPRAMATAPATPASTPAAPVATADPAPVTPMAQDAQTAAPASPVAPVTEASARTDEAMLWALGGGALLLLGLGGTALVRRRRVNDRDAVAYDPAIAPAPVAPMPMATHAAPVAEPVAPRPVMAPVSHRVGEDATLEAMVAAAPSADNPFLTRTKRLRRAQHLLAQRDAMPATTAAPQTTHAEPAAPAPALDRSQTVYRFGSQPARPGFLKPRTR